MTTCNYIEKYAGPIERGEVYANRRLKAAMPYIRKKLSNPDAYCDVEKTEKAKEIISKYFFDFLPWELFVLALIHCYYRSTDTVVFDEILLMMGTGNGKNGFISAVSFYLTTHLHGIAEYNIEIIANSENQAKTSFDDIYNVLDSEKHKTKLKRFFYKSKEIIRNLKTGSVIKFNTSNAKTRLGKRAGCLIFDEILEYADWVVYNAFNASFGKKKHSRKFLITTNGYLRGGLLDDKLRLADRVLNGEIENIGLLPLIYELDDKEQVHKKELWLMANPSLPYFPELQKTLETQYIEMQHQPQLALDFLTKRMDLTAEDAYTKVAVWGKVMATNKPIPYYDLQGQTCVGAFDYAEINDFCSCGLLFKHGGKRYWIEHTFVCHKALQMESRRIAFPVREMADKGLITIVHDDIIKPERITEWFLEKAKCYNIVTIAADSYRASIVQSAFEKEGLPLKIVRSGPITHAKIAPLVEVMFSQEEIIFDDNPTMRWYVENTCTEIDKKGNTTYLKVEPHTRKTDGFFALIHALTQDSLLQESDREIVIYDAYTY